MKHLTILSLLLTLISTFAQATNPFNNINTSKSIKTLQQSKYIYAKQASKNGHREAQFDLAIMYATGDGVEKNEREAFKWFHKSARNGHTEAKYLMGVSFNQGRGVRQQKELARYWFKLAAKAGHAKAIYQLALIEKYLAHATQREAKRYVFK